MIIRFETTLWQGAAPASLEIIAVFPRDPREHWLKPHFSKNEVAKSGGDAAHLPRIWYNVLHELRRRKE